MAGKRKKFWKRRGGKSKSHKGRVHQYAGYKMASKSETKFAEQLDDVSIPWTYEAHKFDWVPPLASYKPDFNLLKKDGTYMHIEYKGFLRNEDKRKMICIREQRPDLDIRFIFEKANKPVQGARPRKDGTKLSHKEWAVKYGYKWAEGFIPKEWWKELKL